MKLRKLFVPLIAALVLTLTVSAANAAEAAASGECGADGGNLTWALTDDGTLTVSGTGAMADFSNGVAPWADHLTSITSVVIEEGVTSIGVAAFYQCSSLTNVDIPDSVTEIGDSAFRGCSALTELDLPDSMTVIRYYSFYGCSSLTDVTVPDGVTGIEKHAFDSCRSLTSVTLPSSVTDIGEFAFSSCGLREVYITDLSAWCQIRFENATSNPLVGDADLYWNGSVVTELVIPDSVTEIGSYAFAHYDRLTGVELGSSVTVIGKGAFSYCTSLPCITIPDSVTEIGGEAFYRCTSLTDVELGNSLEHIGASAFYQCSSLTELVIPDSVVELGAGAFSTCSSMTYVRLPAGLTAIPVELFMDCRSLQTLDLGENIAAIGAYAFYDCSSLTELELPDPITSIGQKAFLGCSGLKEIKLPASLTSIEESAFQGCSSLPRVEFPDTLVSIGKNAFLGCSALTELDLPDSVEVVYPGAFKDCRSLARVRLSEQLAGISKEMFAGCCALTEIHLPDSVLNIGEYAFSGCTALQEIDLRDTVFAVYKGAFYSCPCVEIDEQGLELLNGWLVGYSGNGTELVIPEGVEHIGNGVFEPGMWESPKAFTSVTLPDSLLSIGDGAFDNCRNLAGNVTIPDSVLYIGKRAFNACSSLSSVTFGSSLTYVGSQAFELCSNLTEVHIGDLDAWYEIYFKTASSNPLSTAHTLLLNGEPVTELTVPDSVTAIGQYAFYGLTGLTRVVIPDSVTEIGDDAFRECPSLAEVTGGGSVTMVDAEAFYDSPCVQEDEQGLKIVNTWVLGCSGAQSTVTVPEGITVIGSYAFYSNRNLREISFPDSLISIGYEAFNSCIKLKSVELPDRVVSVHWKAFWNCAAMTELTLGASVTTVDPTAFGLCQSLVSLTVSPDNSCFCSLDNVLYSADMTTLLFCPLTKTKLVIPDSVAEIDSEAFGLAGALWANRRDHRLQEITIGSGVTRIGYAAFYNCAGLTRVTFLGDAPEFEGDVFFDVTATCYYPANNGTWTNDVMHDHSGTLTWTSYEDDEDSKNNSAVFASGQCGDSVTWTLTEKGTLTLSGTGAMWDYPIDYPEYYTYADQITSIVVEEGVTSIGSYAFYDCKALISVFLPEGLTTLGEGSFYGCTALPRITVPASVTSLSGYAFSGCSSLSEVEFLGGAPAIGSSAFANVTAVCLYPAAQLSWKPETMQNYGGSLTWTPYGEGHVHVYTATTVPPTCTEDGYTAYTCEGCGDTYTDSSVAAAGHVYVLHEVTDATCTEDGCETYLCTCGDSYSVTLPATGHHYGDWYVSKAVSCLTDGEERRDCTGCGHCETRTVAANCPSSKFADVGQNAWYHIYVDFVVERGLMNGTSATTFAPTTVINRASVAVLLWNMAGKPEHSVTENPFSDVKENFWYTDAIFWAYENGVVSGNGAGGFNPNNDVTREQLAVMLFKFAQHMGYDLTAAKDVELASFPDGDTVSGWAASYLKWACDLGLINGKAQGGQNYLAPKDTATRAEIAVIFTNFTRLVESN